MTASQALDSASLSTDHVVINQNVPLVSQQQISVESPANADVVTLQVGTSVRRTDKHKDNGLLLAIIDTVTLNRKTAMAVSDDTHTGGSVQKPRAYTDENPPTAMPLRHDGLSYRFPFHTEKKTYPYFDPIALRIQVGPERYRIETIVLPLIDNTVYSMLAQATEGPPRPLDALPVPKRNIFSVAVKFNKMAVAIVMV